MLPPVEPSHCRNAPVRPPRSALGRFARNEEGGMLAWSLTTTMGMLLATGIGMSTQIAEYRRTMMQNTLDSAVLAATDLDQTLQADAVVADYFTRAGLEKALDGTTVEGGLNFRTVGATASMTMPTFFMLTPEQWTIGARSEANETIENVEISMVLDISGSMRFDDRITPLRAAAKGFVDKVLAGDKKDGTTISIVPYAGQVNPGPLLFSEIGGSRVHDNSSCLFIQDADFDHTGMPMYSDEQVPHFMKWPIAWSHMDWGWCPSDFMRIRPHQNDAETLKTFIDAMRQHDGTGTQYGMKYGLALLDPNSRTALDPLRAVDALPDIAADRPLGWHDDNSAKYIVLMTDGKITDQFWPKHTGFRDYDSDDEDNENDDRNGYSDDEDGIDHDRMNAELEGDRQPGDGGLYRKTNRSKNLSNFYKMCDQAKANGVIVFTIAFEAPSGAAEEMGNCASTPTHFYEVGQLEIESAFSSIARQINQLRLTQ
jgi:Flp pilus assembly protein TadG